MMNKIDFENALMSTIVDYISDQVILRYMSAYKKAAVLFTGALIGYTDAVESLKALKEQGWQLTAVLSKAAGEVLTEKRIKDDIDPDAIYVEGAPVNGRQIISDAQFVIIPALTINTAAKTANCINDNLITNMIFSAMAAGKPVVAAIDGCCPDNKVREQIGFKVSDAYKAKMRSNLADLITYGIVLTTAENLFTKVEDVFTEGFKFPDMGLADEPEKPVHGPNTCGCENEDGSLSGQAFIDKKVIGRIDISRYSGCKTIIVRKDAIITGLAKDAANERGIMIVTE